MGISDLLERARLVAAENEPAPVVPDDVSSLTDEGHFDDVLPPDPKPGKARRGRVPRPSGSLKASASQKRQVSDAVTLILTMLGGAASLRDPLCGNAVLSHAENIADKIVPIVVRNPRMLAWFTESTTFLDYIALGGALAPVATTVWKHHVTHTIGHEHEEGEPVDYSGYTAPTI